MTIQSFGNQGAEDLFNGKMTPAARGLVPQDVIARARRKLQALEYATSLQDLGDIPGNRLHKLKGDRKGQWAIRINEQYRVCFVWGDGGPADVEVVDYHG